MRIEFQVPAVPVPQPRPRAVMAGKHARVHELTHVKDSQGRRKPHAIVAFKATCRHAAAEHYQGPPMEGPLQIRLLFVMPRPKAMLWKTKPMPRVPHHASRDDFENLTKSVLDSFNGLLWRDDGQIWKASIEKVIASGDEAPHVEVVVRDGFTLREEACGG